VKDRLCRVKEEKEGGTLKATDILENILEIFPSFKLEWEHPDNPHKDDFGCFTYWGVFAEFSHYFRDNYYKYSKDMLATLGHFISECMAVPGSDLDNAAATSFLENISGETFSCEFSHYLSGYALTFFINFNKEVHGGWCGAATQVHGNSGIDSGDTIPNSGDQS
jgi:hypothetical protein